MICLGCHVVTGGRLCVRCRSGLHPAPERLVGEGVRLVACFVHEGTAKQLVHHLKYRGVLDYADLVAATLEDRVPRLPVVPVPRALSRRLKYGIDPAQVIGRSLAARLQVPLIDALATPLHTRRRAGRDHTRMVRPFRLRKQLSSPVLLVDDVVTTGTTVLAAMDAIGVDIVRAVAAANVVLETSNVTAY